MFKKRNLPKLRFRTAKGTGNSFRFAMVKGVPTVRPKLSMGSDLIDK